MDNELIKNYYLEKKKLKKHFLNINKYLSKILLSIIFLLLSIIFIKSSPNNYNLYKKYIYENSLEFTKFNSLYKKYFGNLGDLTIPDPSIEVFNSTLSYKEIDNYLNGKVLTVEKNYVVPAINSGIIVYLGDKDLLGNTCIIQGIDGIDIWYSNIDISNLTIYDYIAKDNSLAPVLTDKLYITIEQNGSFINYEDYQV